MADLWNSPYCLDHRRFHVWTEDRVRIAGVHLDHQGSETVMIYCHGFMANKNHMRVPRFVEALATHFDTMAVDLRGHGESGGGCTMGLHEVRDIEATVQYARALGYRRVITIGSSMGGASVIRHAALYQSQDGVVTIGAFADCSRIGRFGSDYGLRLLYRTGRLGNLWSYVTRGTRLDTLVEHESPCELVHRIAPRPLLIIHGTWDKTVHPRSAQQLYASARDPKEIVLIPRGGHDYPHLTEKTAERIQEWMVRYGLTSSDQRRSA